jgi:hypothetical protein
MVEETYAPEVTVSHVARRNGAAAAERLSRRDGYAKGERNMNRAVTRVCSSRSLWIAIVRHQF